MLGQRDRWRFSGRRDASAQSGLHPGYDLSVRAVRAACFSPQLCGPVSVIAAHSWEITRFPFISSSFHPILSDSSLSLPPPLPLLLAPQFYISTSVSCLARCPQINGLHNRRTCKLR